MGREGQRKRRPRDLCLNEPSNQKNVTVAAYTALWPGWPARPDAAYCSAAATRAAKFYLLKQGRGHPYMVYLGRKPALRARRTLSTACLRRPVYSPKGVPAKFILRGRSYPRIQMPSVTGFPVRLSLLCSYFVHNGFEVS